MPDSHVARRLPQFNHVAISLPPEALDASHRADLLRFYDQVFGWTEMPTMTEDRVRLVLRAYSFEQFVFLIADPTPMTCARMDHLGMSVGSVAELDEMYQRAKTYQARDKRVEVIDRNLEDHGVVKLHSFYVRYLLPLMIEVQHFDWLAGFDPAQELPQHE